MQSQNAESSREWASVIAVDREHPGNVAAGHDQAVRHAVSGRHLGKREGAGGGIGTHDLTLRFPADSRGPGGDFPGAVSSPYCLIFCPGERSVSDARQDLPLFVETHSLPTVSSSFIMTAKGWLTMFPGRSFCTASSLVASRRQMKTADPLNGHDAAFQDGLRAAAMASPLQICASTPPLIFLSGPGVSGSVS